MKQSFRQSRPQGNRTQKERSAAMKSRLIEAAVKSLQEKGYAATTAVEICKRAGVTRGALFHQFDDLAALLAETLDHLYERTIEAYREAAAEGAGGATLVDALWASVSPPEFKAVIELWLAARNEPELAATLAPVIDRFGQAIDPQSEYVRSGVPKGWDISPAFHRLLIEAMIGMALGRAVMPAGKMGHEEEVLQLLRSYAQESDAPSK